MLIQYYYNKKINNKVIEFIFGPALFSQPFSGFIFVLSKDDFCKNA